MTGLFFYQLQSYLQVAVPLLVFYALAVACHFVLLRVCSRRAGWVPWIAALFPIMVMLSVKYLPGLSEPFRAPLNFIGKRHIAEFLVGLSYMAFRLSHMTVEVRNKIVPPPTFWEYMSFAFFVPTLAVGPISRYSVFRESLYKPDRNQTPIARSLLRMLVGVTKYVFLGSLLEQLAYAGLLLDSHPHPKVDLVVAALAFYLYLYLNFSGYCDMSIGVAGLLGIRVDENFNRPFISRNIQEFWTRWHMTLSAFLRDMLFAPFSKSLVRSLGPRAAPHAIAISIAITFLAMGAWHGLARNFLIYGALQGLGVVVCHYYTIGLKNRLGKIKYAAYQKNKLVQAAATTVTFLYQAGSLFFFANTPENAATIIKLLR